MSDPKKHHYVPQVYLQRFAMNQSGDLITIKVKANPGKKAKPKKKNKSQVCYSRHEYRYQTAYYLNMAGTIDPNIIEKKAFAYENTRLTSLFDKIDRNKKLNRSQTEELIKILIHLKKRNPVFRQYYQDFKDFNN